MARMPVSGVRTSCAKAASAVSTTFAESEPLRRDRASLPEPAFVGDPGFRARLVAGALLVRRELGFRAMILRPPAGSHHAMGEPRESRRCAGNPQGNP